MSTEQVAYDHHTHNSESNTAPNLSKKSSLDKIRSKVKNIFSHKDNTNNITQQIGSLTTDNTVDLSQDNTSGSAPSIFSPTHSNHTQPNKDKNKMAHSQQQQQIPSHPHQQQIYAHPAHNNNNQPHPHHTNQIQQPMYNQRQPQIIANHHYATQPPQNVNGGQGHYINHQNVNVSMPQTQPVPQQPTQVQQQQPVQRNSNALYSMGINNPKVQNRLQALNNYSTQLNSNNNKLVIIWFALMLKVLFCLKN